MMFSISNFSASSCRIALSRAAAQLSLICPVLRRKKRPAASPSQGPRRDGKEGSADVVDVCPDLFKDRLVAAVVRQQRFLPRLAGGNLIVQPRGEPVPAVLPSCFHPDPAMPRKDGGVWRLFFQEPIACPEAARAICPQRCRAHCADGFLKMIILPRHQKIKFILIIIKINLLSATREFECA